MKYLLLHLSTEVHTFIALKEGLADVLGWIAAGRPGELVGDLKGCCW